MLRYLAAGAVRWKNGMLCNTRTNWEFYAVVGGRCGMKLSDGQAPIFAERTLWIFAPECSHAWANDGGRSYHRFAFHFGSVPYPLDEIVRARGGWICKSLSDTHVSRLRRIADDLAPHYKHPTQISSLHFHRSLIELSLLALEGETFADAPPALTDLAHFKVERALSWYREHLPQQPTIKEVADALHISPSHLRRLFIQVRKTSPKAIFRLVRLERANDLMARTTLTLEQIARQCGYADASHLCREYKFVHRFTPNTWRRRLIDHFVQPIPAHMVHLREHSLRPEERTMRA